MVIAMIMSMITCCVISVVAYMPTSIIQLNNKYFRLFDLKIILNDKYFLIAIMLNTKCIKRAISVPSAAPSIPKVGINIMFSIMLKLIDIDAFMTQIFC